MRWISLPRARRYRCPVPGAATIWCNISSNSVTKSSFASRCSRHQRSSASNRAWASSSRTIFTPRSISLKELPRIHTSAGRRIVQGPIQRRVQFGPLFGRQFVADHQDLDFRSVRQVRWFIQDQPAIFHLNLACLHTEQFTTSSIQFIFAERHKPDPVRQA